MAVLDPLHLQADTRGRTNLLQVVRVTVDQGIQSGILHYTVPVRLILGSILGKAAHLLACDGVVSIWYIFETSTT
jgi:hypothetical protein